MILLFEEKFKRFYISHSTHIDTYYVFEIYDNFDAKLTKFPLNNKSEKSKKQASDFYHSSAHASFVHDERFAL